MKTYSEFLSEEKGRFAKKRAAYQQKQNKGMPGVRVPSNRPPAVGKAGKIERIPQGGALAKRPQSTNNPAKTPFNNVAGAANRTGGNNGGGSNRGGSNPQQKPAQKPENVRRVGLGRTQGQIKKTLDDRKGGVMGGIKSALGGDVVGMRARKGDTKMMDSQRQKMNKSARKEFGKKLPGRVLGAAKWVGAEGRQNVKSAATDSASASAPKGQTINKHQA